MSTRAIGLSLMAALVAFSVAFAGGKPAVVVAPAAPKAVLAVDPASAPDVIFLAKSSKDESGAFLGIVPEEVTSDIAADYGVAAGQGVLVEETVSGSPADDAGLRANDVITMINGARLTGPSELRVQLEKYKDGDKVVVQYYRGGKERSADVTLVDKGNDGTHEWSWQGEFPDLPDVEHLKGLHKWSTKERSSAAFAGIVTQELSDGLKNYFKVEGGALISEVVEDSPAEKAGLLAGDVILKIGSEKVADQGDVSDVIRDRKPEETVDFHIMREGKSMVIPVTLTNRKDFYGDASDSEFAFSFDEEDAEALEKEMEMLQEQLQGLGVELEDLPDVKMDMKFEGEPPRVFVGSGEARAISSDKDWWNWSFQELRERVQIGVEALKRDLELLKAELKELKSELKSSMSFWRDQTSEVISQA
jgi:chaperonin cofactor prefoldin